MTRPVQAPTLRHARAAVFALRQSFKQAGQAAPVVATPPAAPAVAQPVA